MKWNRGSAKFQQTAKPTTSESSERTRRERSSSRCSRNVILSGGGSSLRVTRGAGSGLGGVGRRVLAAHRALRGREGRRGSRLRGRHGRLGRRLRGQRRRRRPVGLEGALQLVGLHLLLDGALEVVG